VAHGVVNPYLVTTRSGDCATWTGDEPCPYWFDDETVPSAYVGSYGFLVFCGLGIMLADGVWSIVEITFMLISSALSKDGTKADIDPETKALDELFQGDKSLPWWTSLVGYAVFGSSCVAIMHFAFHVIWYQTVVGILIIPIFAIAILQSVGMTDWNMCSAFGKLLMFGFGAWNRSSGEIIPSLALCMVNLTHTP
jgi:hypothetical protein